MTETPQMKPNVSYFHLVISAIIVVYSWIFSLTILFPFFVCLKLSQRCRNKFFAWLLPFLISRIGPQFQSLRKKLFEHLPTDSTRNVKVLEIGVGPGTNFEYYSKHFELTLLDMNVNFEADIREKLKKYPDLKVEKIVFAMAEDMKGVPDFAYDVVVCTHLLCSVREVDAVLREVARVLKPNGKFLYMEHIGFPVSFIPRCIQTIINPLWRVYCNGCNVNRPTHNIISKAFTHNSYQISYPLHIPLFFRPHVIGVASQPRISNFKFQ